MTEGDIGQPCSINARGAAYDAARSAFSTAWGVEPVDTGMGGSIPFIAEFQQAFPNAAVLVTGVEDPDTRAHGIDEGLHLEEFAQGLSRRGTASAELGLHQTPRERRAFRTTLGLA